MRSKLPVPGLVLVTGLAIGLGAAAAPETFNTALPVAAGELDHAVAVAVAANGTVFVSDLLNHRVQRWRPPR